MTSSRTSIEHQWRKLGAQQNIEQPAPAESATGYEDGYAQGLAEAKAQFERDQREALEQLRSLLTALEGTYAELQRQAHAETVHMVAALFKAMLNKQLFGSQETFNQAVELLTAQLSMPLSDLKLHLHPSDCEILQQHGVQSGALEISADTDTRRGVISVKNEFVLAEVDVLARVAELLGNLQDLQETDA